MDDGTRDVRSGRSPTTQPYEEEFLFHLSRGSEFLVENHVERAKEELERALRYQPHDAKGQDLLASVYFRLGLYPRAIEIWSRLARSHPGDLALRVNLGLVLLKTGQPEEARANFQRATEIDPKHARAFRYLGLAQWRCGQLDAARESFLHGGEVTMARRMEEMLGEASEPARSLATEIPEETAGVADRAEVRSAATDALERFATDTTPLEVEPSHPVAPGGTWTVVEQGRESVPRTTHGVAEARGEVETLARRLSAWSIPSGSTPRLSVAGNGLLVITTADPVAFRAERLRAVRGPLKTEPLPRRARSEGESTLTGFVLAPSGVHAFVAPPEQMRFVAVALTDDALFVVASRLEAFEGTLAHETAMLADAVEVVSLRGTGIAVLRVRAEPSAVEIGSGQLAHVDSQALVGWSGRLFPAEGAEAPASGMLAFRGEGTLLVT